MGTDKRREEMRAIKEPTDWGKRCLICGNTDANSPEGHRVWNCKETEFDAVDPAPVLTRWVAKAGPGTRQHLETLAEPLVSLCYEWNWERTTDGRCWEKDCPFVHQCSLCMSESHRAVDCDAREYCPLLAPRPIDMCPRDVDECWLQYTSRRSRTPSPTKASQPSSYRAKPVTSTPSQILMPPPSFSAATPSPTMSTRALPSPPIPSLFPKAIVVDSWFNRSIKPSTKRPALAPAKLPTSTSPLSLADVQPFRFDPQTGQLFPELQAYPAFVPRNVMKRPGYKCRMHPTDFYPHLPESEWRTRLTHVVAAAGQLKAFTPEGLAQQRQRDMAMWSMLQVEEAKHGVEASDWEVPSVGRVGDARFQAADGDVWKAGIVILANYPPSHPSPHAFTKAKDGTAMLSQGGLESATLSGNAQLAFINAVPLHFNLDVSQRSMTSINKAGKRITYPPKVLDASIEARAEDTLNRCRAGACQVVLATGKNPRKILARVAELAAAKPDDFQLKAVRLSHRPLEPWETGVPSVEGMLLAQVHGTNGRPVGVDASLFAHAKYDKIEKTARHAADTDLHTVSALHHDFQLLSHRDYPDRCILMHSTCHMAYATDRPEMPDLGRAIELDMAITFLEDLYFGRFSTGRFPLPSFRFTARKRLSVLVHGHKDLSGLALAPGLVALLEDFQKASLTAPKSSSLHPIFLSMLRGLSVKPDDKGAPLDVNDAVAVLLVANKARIRAAPRLFAKRADASPMASGNSVSRAVVSRPSSSSSQHSARHQPIASGSGSTARHTATPPPRQLSSQADPRAMASSSTQGSHTPTAAEDEAASYPSYCLCGIVGNASDWYDGRALLKEVKMGGNVHKVTAGHTAGDMCVMNIPQDHDLMMKSFMHLYRSRTPKLDMRIHSLVVEAAKKFGYWKETGV
jgi:hypothetical protein